MLFFRFFDIIVDKEINYWGDGMIEITKVTNMIEKYRAKYSEFFSVLQDEYLDEKSSVESEYGYNIVDDDKETFYVDTEKMEEFEKGYTKKIVNIFDKIKEDDEKNYKFLITLMYHDYIMLLEYYSDEFTKEEIEQIEDIEFDDDIKLINSFEDLDNYLEGNPDFYLVLMNYIIQFYDLNYYDVRSLYYKNDKNDKYLSNIFPSHIIDKLYFTRTITSNELIDEFKRSEEVAQTEIIGKLQFLQIYDKKNYDMLVSEMLENFYKNVSYKRSIGMCEDVNYNLLSLLENGNITFLKNNVTGELNSLKCLIQELYNDKIIYDEEFREKANSYYSLNGQKVKEKILRKAK